MCRGRIRGPAHRSTTWRTPRRDRELPSDPLARRYRRNGRSLSDWQVNDIGTIRSSLSGFVDLYRHHFVVFRRHCQEGRLNPKQLRLIEALYIDGLSLREFARLEGVAPQAISARIGALANKAPEFYRWWRRVNERRRRRN
jgi:hypothetical protein